MSHALIYEEQIHNFLLLIYRLLYEYFLLSESHIKVLIYRQCFFLF